MAYEDLAQQALTFILPILPHIIFIGIVLLMLVFSEFFINRIYHFLRQQYGQKYGVQISKMWIKTSVYLVAVLLIMTNIPGISTNILQLLGIAVAVIIAFSSSTVIANGMSGLLIRIVEPYQLGDMIKVGGNFGKVGNIGLFQTELQTPKRQIVTIPNNVVMNEPMTNYTTDGYIINIPVSIGYDVEHTIVEDLLLKAAKKTGLEKPFVLITSLGDHSVSYEANGLLMDSDKIVQKESKLREEILNEFKSADIEITSPVHNAVRMLPEGYKAVPHGKAKFSEHVRLTESLMFDKADKDVKRAEAARAQQIAKDSIE